MAIPDSRKSGPVPAPWSGDAPSADEEIGLLLSRYQAAFESLDAMAIADFWCAPTFSIEGDVVLTCSTGTEVLKVFEAVVAGFRKANIGYAQQHCGDVRMLKQDLLEVPVQWALFDRDDRLVKQLNNIYVLRRVEGKWKICVAYLLD